MTPDEQRILACLPATTDFLSAREIGIVASPPGGCANPTWAQPCLIRLTKAGILEMSSDGRFRLKRLKPLSDEIHLAPHIAEILAQQKAA